MPYKDKISGIYVIREGSTGRVYVGSSGDCRQRRYDHFRKLREGRHSKIFQAACDEHGEVAFKFEIIEIIHDSSALTARESHWIAHFQSANPEFGFNTRESPVTGTPEPGVTGEKNPNSKLSSGQVAFIRGSLSRGIGLSDLGRIFKITPQAIWRIKEGLVWAV